MSGASQQQSYGNAAWGAAGPGGYRAGPDRAGPDRAGPDRASPWGQSPWGPSPWAWTPRPGRVLPIVAMVIGFILFWPVGLAILCYNLWSGRMTCWGRRHQEGGRGFGPPPWARAGAAQGAAPWATWRDWCQGGRTASSGNHAFDEYRAETLRRLEDEQQEFAAFLERLRFARDKSEFDQFMNERRTRPPAPPADQPGEEPRS